MSVRPRSAQHWYILTPVTKVLAEFRLIDVESMAANAKRNTSVIRRLENTKFKEIFVLSTFDVVAMYPFIDIKDALDVLRCNMRKQQICYRVWEKLLRPTMYDNYVQANGSK